MAVDATAAASAREQCCVCVRGVGGGAWNDVIECARPSRHVGLRHGLACAMRSAERLVASASMGCEVVVRV